MNLALSFYKKIIMILKYFITLKTFLENIYRIKLLQNKYKGHIYFLVLNFVLNLIFNLVSCFSCTFEFTLSLVFAISLILQS